MTKQKVHTIHHFGLMFFDNEKEADYTPNRPDSSQIVYEGFIDDMTYEEAQKIAEVHPNFEKYYEFAGMPLYKTYTFKTGTESPKLALKTRRSKQERDADLKYVIIWNIFHE